MRILILFLCVLPCMLIGQEPPRYLYKILSLQNWEASQGKKTLVLSSEDDAFIHLATEEQLPRIAEKFWSQVPEYVILTLETKRLEGNLVLEANPGGTTKYYHLYKGAIPLTAVTESKIIRDY